MSSLAFPIPSTPYRWLTRLFQSKRFLARKRWIIQRKSRVSFLEKLEDRHTAGAAIPLPLSMMADAINIKPELPSKESILGSSSESDKLEALKRKPKFDLNAPPANRFERPFESSMYARSNMSREIADFANRINDINRNSQPDISHSRSSLSTDQITGQPLGAALEELGPKDQKEDSSARVGGVDASPPKGDGGSGGGGGGGGGDSLNLNPVSRDGSPMDHNTANENGGSGSGSGGGSGGGGGTASDTSISPTTTTDSQGNSEFGGNATPSVTSSTNKPTVSSADKAQTNSRPNVPNYATNEFRTIGRVRSESSSVGDYLQGLVQIASANSQENLSIEAWSRTTNSLIGRSAMAPVDGIGSFEFSIDPNQEIEMRLVDGSGNILAQSSNTTIDSKDSDFDGVSDTVEKSIPGNQDRNHDGVDDYLQASVTNLLVNQGGRPNFVTLDAKGFGIHEARSLSLPPQLSHLVAPIGMLDFKITGLQPGARTSVDLFVPNPKLISNFSKYDPVSGLVSDFSFDGQTGATLHNGRITLNFVDGGRGDADGIVNGEIHDPFIPGGSAIDVGAMLSGANLATWTTFQHGAATGNLGSATNSGTDVILAEGSSYLFGIKKQINVGATPNILRFRYEPVQFDKTAINQIKDAFEVAVLDNNGLSLVSTFVQPDRDAYLNVSESVSIDPVSFKENSSRAVGAYETQLVSGGVRTVDLDISNVPVNSNVTVVIRLTNPDNDTQTKVKLIGGITPPTVVLNGPSTINEGSPYTLNLASSVAGSEPITGWNINWGDGTAVQNITGNPSTVVRTYPDDDPSASRTILATALTVSGAQASASKIVVVGNIPPTSTQPANVATITGVATSFPLGNFTDPGFSFGTTTETFSVDVDWGDGSNETFVPSSVVNGSAGVPTNGTIGSRNHTYATPGAKLVSVKTKDDDGGESITNFTVTVTTAIVTFPPITGQEGSGGTTPPLSATVNGLVANATYTYEVLWGNNTTSTGTITGTGSLRTFTATKVYADNGSFNAAGVYSNAGTYGVTVRIKDSASVIVASSTGSADVGNLAPVSPGNGTDTAVAFSSKIFALGTFTDSGFKFNTPAAAWGSDESFTATVNWGDGTVIESITPTVTLLSSPTRTQIALGSKAHIYKTPGTFTAVITVTDDDGGSTTRNLTVTVTGPIVTYTNPTGIEGTALAAISVTASNLVVNTVYTYEVVWGDNTANATGSITGTTATRTFSIPAGKIYRDNGSFTSTGTYSPTGSFAIAVRIKQGTAIVAEKVGTATISNAASTPPANTSITVAAQASTSFVLTATGAPFIDKGFSVGTAGTAWASAETFTAVVNWGDGSPVQSITNTPTIVNATAGPTNIMLPNTAHTYNDAGVYSMVITVTDDDGNSGSKTITVTATGVDIALPNITGSEGSASTAPTLNATVTQLVVSTAYNYQVLWGDNQTSTGNFTPTTTSFTINTTHRFADNGGFNTAGAYSPTGTYPVTLRVLQGTTLKASQSAVATISNVAPTKPADATIAVATIVNNTIPLGIFTDPGFSIGTVGQAFGSAETFTASLVWSDGLFPIPAMTQTVTNPGSTTTPKSIDLGSQVRTFNTPGTYVATITFADDDGGAVTRTITVNAAGVSIAFLNLTGSEGNSGTAPAVAAAVSGLTSGTTYQYDITWGDNLPNTSGSFTATATTFALNASHRFADNGGFSATGTYSASGTYSVTVRIKDSTGTNLLGSKSGIATITNIAPTKPSDATLVVPTVVNNTIPLGIFTDPGFSVGTVGQPWGSAESFTASLVWSDGLFAIPAITQTVTNPGSTTTPKSIELGSQVRTFNTAGTYSATVTFTDDDGGTVTRIITVNAVSSNISFTNMTGDEGSTVTFAGTASGLNSTVAYTAVINWGDGTAFTTINLPTGATSQPINSSHTYVDNGVYNVTLTIKDGATTVATTTGTSTIANLAPVLDVIADQWINPDTQPQGQVRLVSFASAFTDPGLIDTHVVNINWGDNTPLETGTVTQSPRVASDSHQYAANGIYVATVTLTDNAGANSIRTFKVYVSGEIIRVDQDSFVEIDLSGLEVEAGYNNELGLYIVQDAQGTIQSKVTDANGNTSVVTYVPGQPGYAKAALSHPSRRVILSREYMAWTKNMSGPSRAPHNYRVLVEAGSFISFYAIQNQTTDWWLANNPTNKIDTNNYKQVAFFTQSAANPDSSPGTPIAHFHLSPKAAGVLRYGHEDLLGVQNSDWDYDDLNFTIKFNPIPTTNSPKFFVANNGVTNDSVFYYTSEGKHVSTDLAINVGNTAPIGATSN